MGEESPKMEKKFDNESGTSRSEANVNFTMLIASLDKKLSKGEACIESIPLPYRR